MKKLLFLISIWTLFSCSDEITNLPEYYKNVDQVLWVVSDLQNTIVQYEKLGFSQVLDLGKANVISKTTGEKTVVRIARANLAGALVNWIQPLEGNSVFTGFHDRYGDGALSLVHRLPGNQEMKKELRRMKALGISVLDDISIETSEGSLRFVLLNTEANGKYVLGLTLEDEVFEMPVKLSEENRHEMKLNQYAFAIRDPDPVSVFWHNLGQPEFQISNPELGETMYYGEIVDHKLIQGWQRHGSIAYEWCIPVKPPIVYEDHIKKHGEGIHHLAFSVNDMDKVLEDYKSHGFIVSMGGTWGEKGKPGSGRYEYIDLENSGGVTMELLWNYKE